MRFTRTSIALIAASVLLPSASAQAQKCKAPPGTSGIEQYCESVPSAGGNRGKSDRDDGAGGIDLRTRRALESEGPAGAAILGLDGRPATDKSGRGGRPRQELGKVDNDEPSSSPFAALGAAIGFGDTSGPAFTWFLLVSALGLSAAGWMRYRRRT